MRLQTGERRIKRVSPALQLAWMVIYLPMMTGELMARHPVLFILALTILLLVMTCARRITLTNQRLMVDTPLFSWLAYLPRLGWLDELGTYDQHPLSDVAFAEVDGGQLVLVYRSGVRARVAMDNTQAEAFAEALNEALTARVAEQVKVSERPAVSAFGLTAQDAAAATLRCPYCHDDLAAYQATACGTCRTLHHGECLSEHGKCAILGCAGRPQRVYA